MRIYNDKWQRRTLTAIFAVMMSATMVCSVWNAGLLIISAMCAVGIITTNR